jgi:predicted P-loop ATPase
VAKSEAARIVPPREEAPPRRKKNPAHKHTYEVTTLAPNPMISKGRLTDVITYLSTDAWEGVLQYDAFAGHPLAVDPPIALRAEQGTLAQSDATSVRALLEHQGIAVGKDLAFDALEAVCYANKFDPLKEHILALPPGDPKILEGLAARLFGATEHIEEVFFRKFLMGSIARALVPGCKFDEMLILSGEGGARKSTFAEVLCQEIAWFCDALPALDTDNVIRQLQGKWIVEVAELAATKRSDIETQKAFTSRRSDRFTQKYERHAEDHPRRCVFLGTTNDQEILFDTNGNRRYWCIEVRLAEIPIDWFREHRDQILAAARDLYLSGEPLYLSPEEKVLAREQTHQFEVSDTWTEKLAEYCAGKDEVKVSRALAFLGVPIERQGVAEQRRVGGCLRMLGCSRKVNRGTQGTRLRVWVPPDELRAAKPSGAVVAFDRQPG